jgi:hypothetical protein
MKRRPVRPKVWVIVAASAVLAVLAVAAARTLGEQRARAAAGRDEARVRALLRDTRVVNCGLQGHPLSIMPAMFGRYFQRRREMTLVRIDPLKKTVPEVIDACRGESASGGVPAEISLGREVPVADVREILGPYSSRTREDFRRLKGVEFFTYGYLDVGVHEGAIVLVRVR